MQTASKLSHGRSLSVQELPRVERVVDDPSGPAVRLRWVAGGGRDPSGAQPGFVPLRSHARLCSPQRTSRPEIRHSVRLCRGEKPFLPSFADLMMIHFEHFIQF